MNPSTIDGIDRHVSSFEKCRSDDRKSWLLNYNKNKILTYEQKEISYSDFIHKDLPHTYSMLIYLSPTNLNSGTDLYNENKEMVNSFKFVQNRAIIFNSGYYHKAINNHGNDLDDGRLTLNIFMDVPEMSQQ